MQSRSKQQSRKLRIPRGVSFVEFVGCLAALGGGVVLGSMYLGVDVQTLAAGILEKADIEVPAILRENTQPNEPTPVAGEVEENVSSTLSDETPIDSPSESLAPEQGDLAVNDGENSGENSADSRDEAAGEGTEPIKLTDAETLAATQACWLALNECISEEVDNRSKWLNDSQSWQLFDYLLYRKEGHQKVVASINQLDQYGIDPRLHAYVQQVLSWHRAGAELFERAAQLLTDAPAGNLTGPFAQSWQSAATQHRMEEKLILNKHDAVASYLEHLKKISSASSPSN